MCVLGTGVGWALQDKNRHEILLPGIYFTFEGGFILKGKRRPDRLNLKPSFSCATDLRRIDIALFAGDEEKLLGLSSRAA